jgi:hypothetical protein
MELRSLHKAKTQGTVHFQGKNKLGKEKNYQQNQTSSQVWRHIPAFGRWVQKDLEFEASLGYIVSPHF